MAAEWHSMSLLPPLLLYRCPHFRHRGCTIISFMVHSLFLLASPSPFLMRLIWNTQTLKVWDTKKIFVHKMPQFRYQKIFSYTKCRSFGTKKDFHAQNAAVSVPKKIFVHKMPQFRYQKRFSCTKCRSFGTKKDFHAQKAAVSASKNIFMHKRPPFRHQKTFSCTKGRHFGTKKDFRAQKAAICRRN